MAQLAPIVAQTHVDLRERYDEILYIKRIFLPRGEEPRVMAFYVEPSLDGPQLMPWSLKISEINDAVSYAQQLHGGVAPRAE